MVAGYERALGSIPPETLGPALLNTLRNVKFWPTPGNITDALGELAREKSTLRSLPTGCASDDGKTWKLLKGCAECDGSTWRRVTLVHNLTGIPYEAVTPCACQGNEDHTGSLPF